MGYAAAALLHSGKTGLISSVCLHLYCFLSVSIFFSFQTLFSFSSPHNKADLVFLPRLYRTSRSIQVGNLCAPVEQWTVGGTALTSLMDVERRRGRAFPLPRDSVLEKSRLHDLFVLLV